MFVCMYVRTYVIGVDNVWHFMPGASVAVKFCTFSHIVCLFVNGKEPLYSFLQDGSLTDGHCTCV